MIPLPATRAFFKGFAAWAVALLVFMGPGKVFAYVLPPEQLAGLMARNFSGLRTMVITQKTTLVEPLGGNAGAAGRERLWLKSPGLYALETIGVPGDRATGRSGPELKSGAIAFRRLLMVGGGGSALSLLSHLGVDVETVGMTRFDGIIAYRIGAGDTESPKLIVDKERFLPLFFQYRTAPGSDGKTASVRFGDYREAGKGWYPHEIACDAGEGRRILYRIVDIQVNVPIDRPLWEIPDWMDAPAQDTETARDDREEEHLRRVIQQFKEKYR